MFEVQSSLVCFCEICMDILYFKSVNILEVWSLQVREKYWIIDGLSKYYFTPKHMERLIEGLRLLWRAASQRSFQDLADQLQGRQ